MPWLTEEEEAELRQAELNEAEHNSSRETTPDSWEFSEDEQDQEDSGLTVGVDDDSHWSSDEGAEDTSKTT